MDDYWPPLVGPPSWWSFTPVGEPTWAAMPDRDVLLWTVIAPADCYHDLRARWDAAYGAITIDAPAQMPELRRLAHQNKLPPSRPGRPRLETQPGPNPQLYAAWRADILGEPAAEIMRRMKVAGRDEGSARRTTRRWIAGGRLGLHRRGTLPWALWDGGKLPDGWWLSREFAEAVYEWMAGLSSVYAPYLRAHKEFMAAAYRLAVERDRLERAGLLPPFRAATAHADPRAERKDPMRLRLAVEEQPPPEVP